MGVTAIAPLSSHIVLRIGALARPGPGVPGTTRKLDDVTNHGTSSKPAQEDFRMVRQTMREHQRLLLQKLTVVASGGRQPVVSVPLVDCNTHS